MKIGEKINIFKIYIWLVIFFAYLPLIIIVLFSFNDGIAGISVIGMILSAIAVFALVMFSFTGPLPVGDPVEIPNVVMRTNDMTCVTFQNLDQKKHHITSTEAWAYNCGEMFVYGQKQRNSWNIPMDEKYWITDTEGEVMK